MEVNEQILAEIHRENSVFMGHFKNAAAIDDNTLIHLAEKYNSELPKDRFPKRTFDDKKSNKHKRKDILQTLGKRILGNTGTREVMIKEENGKKTIDKSRIRNEFLFYLMDKLQMDFIITKPSIHFTKIEKIEDAMLLHYFSSSISKKKLSQAIKYKEGDQYVMLKSKYFADALKKYLYDLQSEVPLYTIEDKFERYSEFIKRIYRSISVTYDNASINNILRLSGFNGINLHDYVDTFDGSVIRSRELYTVRSFIKPLRIFDIEYRWAKPYDAQLLKQKRMHTFKSIMLYSLSTDSFKAGSFMNSEIIKSHLLSQEKPLIMKDAEGGENQASEENEHPS